MGQSTIRENTFHKKSLATNDQLLWNRRHHLSDQLLTLKSYRNSYFKKDQNITDADKNEDPYRLYTKKSSLILPRKLRLKYRNMSVDAALQKVPEERSKALQNMYGDSTEGFKKERRDPKMRHDLSLPLIVRPRLEPSSEFSRNRQQLSSFGGKNSCHSQSINELATGIQLPYFTEREEAK